MLVKEFEKLLSLKGIVGDELTEKTLREYTMKTLLQKQEKKINHLIDKNLYSHVLCEIDTLREFVASILANEEKQERNEDPSVGTIVVVDSEEYSKCFNEYFKKINFPFYAIYKGQNIRGFKLGGYRPNRIILMCEVDKGSKWYENLIHSMETL
ncbi:hypothetical protein ABFV99_00545 [Cytobacillus horneckiae]|uniref:hypothetical protein n=1 Tax=Cytobacillus horneckiae TaxID=549687 RepID=UPI0034CD98CB